MIKNVVENTGFFSFWKVGIGQWLKLEKIAVRTSLQNLIS